MDVLNQIFYFMAWWTLSSCLAIGAVTIFLMFYKGGVIEINLEKLAGSDKPKENVNNG
jgi:hypothetical protein